MEINNIKKAFFAGIGGIGISALARFFLQSGIEVTGSDMNESKITESLRQGGADIKIGHKAENLPEDADILIYSEAVPENNPERQKAKKKGIEQLSFFKALGETTKEQKAIVISGCHGKTTTTAMTGLILKKGKVDPTIFVGSLIKDINGNFYKGKSEYIVIEGDEYKANFMNLRPQIAVITNIDKDHLDYYKTFNKIIDTFQEYINKIPRDGLFIYNFDDKNLREKIELPFCQVLSYSLENEQADLVAYSIRNAHGRQIFRLKYQGEDLKRDFNLQIPGKYNISNALGAILVALQFNIKVEIIKEVLSQYQGAWRRMERLGPLKGFQSDQGDAPIIFSDYAHHPVELYETVKALKDFYPDKRLLLVFQPHQKQRSKIMFDEFVDVFRKVPAEKIILSEIYSVAGREKDINVSSADMVKAVGQDKDIIYAGNLSDTEEEIKNAARADDVILIAGAGDIDDVARNLV